MVDWGQSFELANRPASARARASCRSLPERDRRSRLTVLTRANSRDRKRARTRLKAEAGKARRMPQTRQKALGAAKAGEAACQQAGVTGSSPVPLIETPCKLLESVARVGDGRVAR